MSSNIELQQILKAQDVPITSKNSPLGKKSPRKKARFTGLSVSPSGKRKLSRPHTSRPRNLEEVSESKTSDNKDLRVQFQYLTFQFEKQEKLMKAYGKEVQSLWS